MLLTKLHSENVFKSLCVCSRILTNNLFRYASSTSENAETIDLAYASYESTGDVENSRPPLVILHGLLGSKNNWNSMSKAIHRTTGRKVISVDARNHGDSRHSSQHTYIHMAHDVMKLLKKLELSKVSLMGHSMGGRTAMVLSLLCSDLVSSLIVVDISPVTTSPQIFSMANLFDAMTSVSVRPGIAMSKARKLADEQLKGFTADVNLRNFLITNLVQTNSGAYTWRVNIPALKENFQSHISSFPSNLRGLQYSGPTLFVGGSLSDYIGKNDLREIQEYFPLADLVFVEGAGHWVHSQKPEKFLEIVCKFLASKFVGKILSCGPCPRLTCVYTAMKRGSESSRDHGASGDKLSWNSTRLLIWNIGEKMRRSISYSVIYVYRTLITLCGIENAIQN